MIYDTAPDIMKILEQCIAIPQYCQSYVQLDKFSCAISARAIFSAVFCLKSLLITVLASCNIPECNRKVFFSRLYYCFGGHEEPKEMMNCFVEKSNFFADLSKYS